jgi:hypothetical protein
MQQPDIAVATLFYISLSKVLKALFNRTGLQRYEIMISYCLQGQKFTGLKVKNPAGKLPARVFRGWEKIFMEYPQI